jgi:hypothetical protein
MQGAGHAKYSVRVTSNTHRRHKMLNTQFRQIALPEETIGSYSELCCRQHVEPVLSIRRLFSLLEKASKEDDRCRFEVPGCSNLAGCHVEVMQRRNKRFVIMVVRTLTGRDYEEDLSMGRSKSRGTSVRPNPFPQNGEL